MGQTLLPRITFPLHDGQRLYRSGIGGGDSADEVFPWASDDAPPNISVCRVISVSGSRSAGSICESIIICIIMGAIPPAFPLELHAAPPVGACPREGIPVIISLRVRLLTLPFHILCRLSSSRSVLVFPPAYSCSRL